MRKWYKRWQDHIGGPIREEITEDRLQITESLNAAEKATEAELESHFAYWADEHPASKGVMLVLNLYLAHAVADLADEKLPEKETNIIIGKIMAVNEIKEEIIQRARMAGEKARETGKKPEEE